MAKCFSNEPIGLFQLGLGLISLQQVNVAPGMVTDTCQNFQTVRQFDHIIIGTQGKRFGLGVCLFLAGKDNQRHLPCCGIGTIIADQGQTVDFRHHQILQDDRGLYPVCGLNGFGGILAKVKINIMLGGQHSA